MEHDARILILGASGLVGSSIFLNLQAQGYKNIIAPSRSELSLLNQSDVIRYFEDRKPKYVFNAAAKVGGIKANNEFRADFILDNLQIQNNVFTGALDANVEILIFLGSSCIYPRSAPQPIREEYLLTSELEPTNEPYAIAKIAGLKVAESLRRQYGKKFFSVMPTNLYGLNDNFHPDNSHVIPGLIQRMHRTMEEELNTFVIWGTGTPRREFLYVDDMAEACIFLMNKENFDEIPHWINIGCGEDVAIKDLAFMIGELMGFKGEYVFNTDMPDGTPRKCLDTSKINALGWWPKISLREGLERTIGHYRENVEKRALRNC